MQLEQEERGCMLMKKKVLARIAKSVTALLCMSAIVADSVVVPAAVPSIYYVSASENSDRGDSGFNASFINKLDKLGIDYKNYLDNSVMFMLPDSVKDDDEISVIISVDVVNIMDAYEGTDKTMSFSEFALESSEADKIRAEIALEKKEFLDKLDNSGIKYTEGEEYDTLLSGFEILIKARDFKTTCQSLNKGSNIMVGEVYNVAKTQLVENKVNVFDTGIFDSAGSGYDGSGMVVAVLDTGLDSAHTAFLPDNFTSTKLGLTYEDVAAVVDKTTANKLIGGGLTVDDVFINNKVPFGFDYADCDPDVYSTHNNHGTHVSGVIVGKDDTITGVAPNAQLVSMKIFSDVMDTARSSWILTALEDCVVLGVDVINMSLGTACGFSRESDEEVMNGVYDKIREAGISMIVAASNSYSSAYGSEANGNLGLTSNPDTGTVGSPSTYKGVMSVASISGVKTPYIKYGDTIMYFTESNNSAAEENHFFDTLLGDKDSAEYDYVLIPGVGRSADYTGLDVKGKIVLVRRGSNTFEEKAIIAQEQGAAGIIIYNNVSGDIKMNVGNATLAVCSISQDDGETLAAKGKGKLKISRSQTSGPFISDFSSWGPTPDLKIKPEITAHGGSILSAVTGGSYERLSGTSMACPNLAGVVILLRQYVVENFKDIADDNVKVNEMVNRLMMSTADIAMNTNGSPYAVRKQGAGLANLMNSINTKAYITTYDADGKEMDKTKLELGDDPEKTGKYEFKFTITNFGDKKLTYNIGAYVMTEGVSETKTNAGKTTVTEEAYILDGASVNVVQVDGKKASGKKVTVGAGDSVTVSMNIQLSDKDKKYLDKSFENGMYIEGFITLEATSGTDIDMNIPYLAFYGDWTKAPLFDKDYYETNPDELDDAIDPEDKTMADAYATRPIGGVSDDYVSYLGSYYFLQDDKDIAIPANRNHIALSNQVGTIHSLRYVWAGLLRNAAKIEVTITDDVTGEIIFERVANDVRKSYGDGGSIYPANVEIEFDTLDYNLANNKEYTVTLKGYMDYGDGGLTTNEKNTFTIPLTIDFEAPTVTDVRYYYEYDSTLKKNRLYAEIAVYDNHYSMSSQLGYVTMGEDENGNESPVMKTFEQYMTPIYSEKDSVTYVKYDLTDYIYQIKDNATKDNTFVVTLYDYALNYATYEIGLPTNYTEFFFEGIEAGIVISPNEVYTLEPLVYPSTEWGELLEYSSSRPGVARVVNNKIVGVSAGKAVIKVTDTTNDKSTTFTVTVLDEGDEGYQRFDRPVADIFRLDGFETLKAYFMVSSEDKKIGDTGSINFFEGNFNLELYPSETVRLNYLLSAYFPKDTTLEFETSNESIVKVDGYGSVTAVAEGFASVTVKVMQEGKSTYYSETVSIEVKDPFVTTGASLTHYYGNGGLVTIPEKLSLTEIGSFAFSNFEYILKTEEELAEDDKETSKQWFIGDNTISKVVIPEGVKKISSYAFANLTALEEVVLPSTLEHIDYGAFYGCTSLEKITFSGENNLKIINQHAFENCNLQGSLDLPQACVISDYAFAGNKNLKDIKLSDRLLSIGQYAFAGCKKVSEVSIGASKVKYGAYAFTGCESLKEFYVNAAVIPEGMFYECEALETVKIGPDVNDIGAYAFRDTLVSKFVVDTFNNTYKVYEDKYILSKDGAQIIAVSPLVEGTFTSANLGGAKILKVGKGAFSHNTKISSVVLEGVVEVADYGFASSERLTSVKLGTLHTIGAYAFSETGIASVPTCASDVKIGKYAFAYSDLTSVVIPDGTVIEEGVFSECASLKSVVIGSNVTIGKYAFSLNKDEAFKILSYNEDGEKYFYYEFHSPLQSLTIGDNVVIGENAFANAADLERVTLGAGAKIEKMAFYNCSSLKNIDLSKAVEIGDYAFSGDVYYVCLDENMAYAAVSKEGTYIYTHHAPMITTANLSSATTVGEYAFAYCRQMNKVVLNSSITHILIYTFAGCMSLKEINLDKVETIDEYAFMEAGLLNANLTSATKVDKYAFVNNKNLTGLTLNPNGTDVEEGAFTYCEKLASVGNLAASANIGDYAFAYTAITSANLTGAVKIGTHAFLKEKLTSFKVTLGEKLETIGDNPFAMCKIDSFSKIEKETFGKSEYEKTVYTFELSPNVQIVDGSLYCKTDKGLELITFAGIDNKDVTLADNTIRITAMAFAGSDIEVVTLPYTVKAIGHKAFYLCNKLNMVTFESYDAPTLEEEYDPAYYDSLENIPGIGDYGTYTDYDGTEVKIESLGIVPYFMWNVTGGMYSNVFYGANFVDYIGHIDEKIVMVKPVNGKNYDTYVYGQYFDVVAEGAAAADNVTLAAIDAINKIPEKVSYADKAIVEAARAAYAKIATTEQQALVTNYADLISAEQRIIALTPVEEEGEVENRNTGKKQDYRGYIIWVALIVLALGGGVVLGYKKRDKVNEVIEVAKKKLEDFKEKRRKSKNSDKKEKEDSKKDEKKTSKIKTSIKKIFDKKTSNKKTSNKKNSKNKATKKEEADEKEN